MSKLIAVITAAVLVGACSHTGKDQNTVNEATTTTGTGNTAGSATAAGPAVNSQGTKENARR
jgi:hypothetical protein